MVGLRTHEDCRYVKFFEMVQKKAEQLDSVFFLDCGEGNTVFKDDIICGDCSGWLVPKDKAAEFGEDYIAFKDDEKWQDWEQFAAWVTWSENSGEILIKIELL